jgi:hypothetical protein
MELAEKAGQTHLFAILQILIGSAIRTRIARVVKSALIINVNKKK